jgi:hypothetical protein
MIFEERIPVAPLRFATKKRFGEAREHFIRSK